MGLLNELSVQQTGCSELLITQVSWKLNKYRKVEKHTKRYLQHR